MSFSDTVRGLIFKSAATPKNPAGVSKNGENPYLNARRVWNDNISIAVSQRQTWQFIGVLSLLITLAAVGGMISIGSKSRFIPYVVQVDKLGQTVAVGPLQAAEKIDPRVVHASLAEWMSCVRLVTPDVALQRKCIFRAYSMLNPNDPSTRKMNEWFNGNEPATPFKRAEKEMVTIAIETVIPQTDDTWQIEWVEITRDRQGAAKSQPVTWRALITTYVAQTTSQTTEEQLRNNPLNIFVRDFSWSRIQ